MEEALVSRLRSTAAIIAIAGTFNGRPAIDWMERGSDDAAAFPAAILSVIGAGKSYDHDGPDGLQNRRVRVECFGRTYGPAKQLSRAIIEELEASKTVGGVRFHRGRVTFERDMDPEDLGGGIKIFRTIIDLIIPAT